ncbi:MAG: signal peptide peptidase SppA [Patescibacteria group bacterium]
MSYITKFLKLLAKIWIVVTSVIGSLFAIALIALVVIGTSTSKELPTYPTRTVTSGGSEKVAIIPLSGDIVAEDTNNDPLAFSSGVISAKKVIPLLDHVMNDDEIKAVVLKVNSPGGGVVASDEIYRKVKELKAKKPVIVSFGDMAASGGYYISAGATEIIANPATITGSIGVIAQFPQYNDLLNKLGVQMRTIKSGEFKDIGSPQRPMTDSEKQIFQSMINEAYDQFVHAIADGRNMDEAKVRQIADGRIYTGKQAKENGLVNELGTVDTAINRAKTLADIKDPTVVEYTERGFFESLLSSSLQKINPLATLSSNLPQTHSGIYYLMSF